MCPGPQPVPNVRLFASVPSSCLWASMFFVVVPPEGRAGPSR